MEELDYFEVTTILRRLFTVAVLAAGGADALGMRRRAEAMLGESAQNVHRAHALLHARTGISILAVEPLSSSQV